MTSPEYAVMGSSQPFSAEEQIRAAVVPEPLLTPRLRLAKPYDDDESWGGDYRAAMDALDAHPGIAEATLTTMPPTPWNGQVVYQSDTGRFLFWSTTRTEWVELVPAPPLPGDDYALSPPAAEFVIAHDFGFRPSVTVTDSAGTEVECEIQHTSGQVTIRSNAPFSGTASLS